MRLTNVFKQNNPIQNTLTKDLLASHKTFPSGFETQLQQHPLHFVNFINNKEDQGLSELQKSTLVHLVLIHTNKYYDLFEKLRLDLRCDDSWICQSILVPYQKFIRKVIYSSELY